MHIILTHEQADFDAIASLLAAYLLDEEAKPVLPRRMNRNVRAYLTIYGVEMPFIDVRDLPAELIENVTLVDTQSMVSVRGMTKKTKVIIVDHHPMREDLPNSWSITVENVGAATTILVESLRDQGESLLASHATLLLLGIYEDTGSLTFSRTSSRDLQAAAFLLSQGASLRVAADFLNHPLSSDQQKLYTFLRDNAENLEIHGHRIVIAAGNALQMDEELSTLAHKLRDLFDPDGLFMLVETRGGVQIIARSTSDNIDVSSIASRFGGGGHDRAAAALVRERSLEEVRSELIKCLPEFISPAITVAQIMSHGLQVLTPETPVVKAAERMQRYGYEGYPVVKQDHVVGLLTRRAVDRAIAHKLNLTAASLMDAGNFFVYPNDSIEHLQTTMADSGWGQLPVVDPGTAKIIGIVTRTDLLKILNTKKGTQLGKRNFSVKLNNALPTNRLILLRVVAAEALEQHFPTFIVGGVVRDLILDIPSLDFDIVVEGDAIKLAKSLAAKYGGYLKTHQRFGTAKWYLKGSHFLNSEGKHKTISGDLPDFLDIISARTEFYTHPTALPTVESGSIKLDLHRRDFTINTLALRLDGHHYGDLHDYWGGLSDLERGLVRVLHSLSFVDDPTRMLRAVRFEQRFGFSIETRTLQLLSEALKLLDRVSGDRIHHELDHILDQPKSGLMLARLDELGLLKSIHPNLIWDDWFKAKMTMIGYEKPINHWLFDQVDWRNQPWDIIRRSLLYGLWFIRMGEDQVKSVGNRIKHPSGHIQEIILAATVCKEIPGLVEKSRSHIATILSEFNPSTLALVYFTLDKDSDKKLIREYITEIRYIRPHVNGNDLRAQGLPPGPAYKQILAELRDGWLDGNITNANQEKEMLDQLIARELGSKK